MKKIILSFLMLAAIGLQAQKTAVVDINDILTNMSQYTQAQEQVDQLAEKWRQQIAQEMDDIKSMYNKYQAEQVLLSEDMKRQKEDDIMEKEKQVRELQKQKFGPEGELFQKRQELIAPIQTKVYKAVENYASSKGIDLVLDKSTSSSIIYLNDRLDITEDIKRMVVR